MPEATCYDVRADDLERIVASVIRLLPRMTAEQRERLMDALENEAME